MEKERAKKYHLFFTFESSVSPPNLTVLSQTCLLEEEASLFPILFLLRFPNSRRRPFVLEFGAPGNWRGTPMERREGGGTSAL